MRHWPTRSRRSDGAALLLALLALAGAGCVTRGTHEEATRERDALRARVQRLETEVERLSAANKSLEGERVRVIDQLEDLRIAHENLEADYVKLRRRESELSTNLEQREAELASRNEELSRLRGTYEGLVEDLEAEVAAGAIQIEQLREGLRLNLSQNILFPSGKTTLNPQGRAVLIKVSKRLASLPHRVEVQGHTDNVPVRPDARFASNWELAAERATEVVRLLADHGIDARRLTAVSYGEHHPVASNATPEGRAKNRRIEIRLEPLPGAPVAASNADAP